MILFFFIHWDNNTNSTSVDQSKKISSSSQHLFVYVAYVSLKGMESNFKIAYFFQLFLVYPFG